MQNAEAGLANPQATVDEAAISRNNTSKTRRIVVAVVSLSVAPSSLGNKSELLSVPVSKNRWKDARRNGSLS